VVNPPVEPPVTPVEPPPVEEPPADLIPHHDVPPEDVTTDTEAAAKGYDAATIAKWLAAGLIVKGLLTPPPEPPSYDMSPFPIPTFNAAGLVNPGVNPGFIQPAPAYNNNGQAGINQYYWGQHAYAQNMSDLANLNKTPNMPAQPYGNPNAVHLGQLVSPDQINYPTLQSLAAAQGTNNPQLGNFAGLANMSYDIYNNPVQMNTAPPPVPGFRQVMGPNTQQQMATGVGQGSQYGMTLHQVPYPTQALATVNNSGMTPAQQLTNISPSQLAAQLHADASSIGT
jgi:hypothetical protein